MVGTDLEAEWVYRVSHPEDRVRWVRDRVQVVVLAYESGLVQPGAARP